MRGLTDESREGLLKCLSLTRPCPATSTSRVNHREQLGRLAFDEQRALEELQNLKREIQRARNERERAEAEFDEFLRGFHEQPQKPAPRPRPAVEEPLQPPRVESQPPGRIEQPQPPPTRIEHPEPPRVDSPQPPQAPGAPAPPSRSAFDAQPAPQQSAVDTPPFSPQSPDERAPFDFASPFPPAFDQASETFQPAPFDTDPEPLPPPIVSEFPPLLVTPRRRQNVGAWVAIPIAVIVLIAIVLMFRSDDSAPASPQTTAQAPVTPAPETAPADTPATQTPTASLPVPTAPPQPGVNLEMVTTRPVWVRVTIDGRRAIERELPAGERIPLHGERSILIRAGDAGAVTITRDGRGLGPLGEDAMPATREFKDTSTQPSRR